MNNENEAGEILNTQKDQIFYTLITGASEGIGRALALECASRGMHVLLVALPGKDLNLLEEKIKDTYHVHCHSFGIDLAQHCSSTAVYEWTKNNGYHINTLINNVGIGSKGLFEAMSTDFYYHQVNLNILAGCIMTREFLDELKINSPGYIMNVGSLGGFYAMPEKTVYAATKAFVYTFSRSLRVELKTYGISVSVLCPAGTNTNKSTTASNASLKGAARLTVMQPSDVAKVAIDGMLAKKSRIIPGYFNKLCYHLSRIVPEFIQNIFIEDIFSHVKKHTY
ncbi:MAG: SDR family NAD(P)-dependent oxidoreductase [Bacteroidota bacterium]